MNRAAYTALFAPQDMQQHDDHGNGIMAAADNDVVDDDHGTSYRNALVVVNWADNIYTTSIDLQVHKRPWQLSMHTSWTYGNPV
jgi:hypothetical protein